MTTPPVELLREAASIAAPVTADPAGLIFAAISRYDRRLERAIIEIARLRGVSEDVVRLDYEMPVSGERRPAR